MYNNKNSNILIHIMLCESHTLYTHVNSSCLNIQYINNVSLYYTKGLFIRMVKSLNG